MAIDVRRALVVVAAIVLATSIAIALLSDPSESSSAEHDLPESSAAVGDDPRPHAPSSVEPASRTSVDVVTDSGSRPLATQPLDAVRIRVVLPDGTAAPHATVHFAEAIAVWSPGFDEEVSTQHRVEAVGATLTPDDDGTVCVPIVEDVVVAARTDGRLAVGRYSLAEALAERSIDLVLERTLACRVVVRHHDGAPASGVRVGAVRPNTAVVDELGVTGADGRCELPEIVWNLESGMERVTIAPAVPGFPRQDAKSVELSEPTELEFVLPRVCRVEVRVRTPSGIELAADLENLDPVGAEDRLAVPWLSAFDAAPIEFHAVAGTAWHITVRVGNRMNDSTATGEVIVVADPTCLDLVAVPEEDDVMLVGTLRAPDGALLPLEPLRWKRVGDNGGHSWIHTSRSGAFCVTFARRHLRDLRSLEILHDGDAMSPWSAVVEVPEDVERDEVNLGTVRLSSLPRIASGVVTHDRNAPVSGTFWVIENVAGEWTEVAQSVVRYASSSRFDAFGFPQSDRASISAVFGQERCDPVEFVVGADDVCVDVRRSGALAASVVGLLPEFSSVELRSTSLDESEVGCRWRPSIGPICDGEVCRYAWTGLPPGGYALEVTSATTCVLRVEGLQVVSGRVTRDPRVSPCVLSRGGLAEYHVTLLGRDGTPSTESLFAENTDGEFVQIRSVEGDYRWLDPRHGGVRVITKTGIEGWVTPGRSVLDVATIQATLDLSFAFELPTEFSIGVVIDDADQRQFPCAGPDGPQLRRFSVRRSNFAVRSPHTFELTAHPTRKREIVVELRNRRENRKAALFSTEHTFTREAPRLGIRITEEMLAEAHRALR